jgi:hypothetical protein
MIVSPSLNHTQLVKLGENILNIGSNIRRRQRIGSSKDADNLIKRILPITEFPDLSGRFIDDVSAAIAAIMENGFLPDPLERDIRVLGGYL